MGNNLPTISQLNVYCFAKDYNSFVSDLFPPHPLALAPSEVSGFTDELPASLRTCINENWGEIKMKAARRNKYR